MQISAICKIQKARPLYAIIIVIRRLWNPLNMLCLEVWGWSVVGMSQTAKSKRNQRESNLAVPWRQRWLSWLVQEWGIPTHDAMYTRCIPTPPLNDVYHQTAIFVWCPKSFSTFQQNGTGHDLRRNTKLMVPLRQPLGCSNRFRCLCIFGSKV